jgi:hypothetical protein
MSVPDLLTVDDLYALSGGAQFAWHEVVYDRLESFAAKLTTLRRSLVGELDDPFWQQLTATARSGLWILAGTPLPASHQAISLAATAERLRAMSMVAAEISMHGPIVSALAEDMEAILREDLDPLGDSARSILDGLTEERACLLLRWPRRASAVQAAFGTTRPNGLKLTVGSASALRELDTYDTIVAIGPSTGFESLIAAPRARDNHIVHLRITPDRARKAAVFAHSKSKGQRLQRQVKGVTDEAWAEQLRTSVDGELLEARTEWGAIASGGQRQTQHEDDVEDFVQARLVLLATDLAVYIDAEEGSSNWVLDPRAQGDERVRLEGWRELIPGMFLVLRTEGGSNIAMIADRILGREATRLRGDQQRWKDALRRAARERGMVTALRELRKLGCGVASEQNVRNWTSSSTIAPGKPSDFAAVMRFVGFDGDTDGLWKQVLTIRNAHRQAGQQLRAALISEMGRADLSSLTLTGRLDVEIPALGAGTLSVLRIEDISPDEYEISRYRVDEPFSIEEAAWHA